MAQITPRVSFTVNVCNSDAPYLEQTLRHMMRQLNFPFAERIATYDPGRQEGKYAERIQGSQNEVEQILQRLLADKLIDRVDVVPWTEAEQHRILMKYFGDEQIDL
ncbi:MAG: glycosyltransferase family 2 protein, partial [Thiobacillus sp.]|nr:glycosyltransferase family 2 protein [Thiobacillus sp.]